MYTIDQTESLKAKNLKTNLLQSNNNQKIKTNTKGRVQKLN